MRKNKKGFTLIELLVVIAIIGLLASVVLLALNSARAKARNAKRLSDARQMSTAFEVYNNEFSGYPATEADLVPNFAGTAPIAPLPVDGSCTAAENTYTYTATGTVFTSPKDGTTNVYPGFTYTFCIGSAVEGFAAGVHTVSPQGIQ